VFFYINIHFVSVGVKDWVIVYYRVIYHHRMLAYKLTAGARNIHMHDPLIWIYTEFQEKLSTLLSTIIITANLNDFQMNFGDFHRG
jgi:hypothetical protein